MVWPIKANVLSTFYSPKISYSVLRFILSFICLLLGVAFSTLLERKFLGLTGSRLRASKPSWFGLMVPLLDGLKLVVKEIFWINKANFLYNLIPVVSFCFSYMFCIVLNGDLEMFKRFNDFLVLVSILANRVFRFFLIGIIRFSKFAKVGSIRSGTQRVSFEIIFSFLYLAGFTLCGNIIIFLNGSRFCILWLFSWIISVLVEIARSPFDLQEGERELISGFNLETGGRRFTFLFLSEFNSMITMPILTSDLVSDFRCIIILTILIFFFFIRAVFPRFRVDFLIRVFWKKVLPLTIFLFLILMLV